jgi:hypothetical protein
MNSLLVFLGLAALAVLRCSAQTTCPTPTSPLIAGFKAFPPLGVDTQMQTNLSVFASCTSCGKGIAKYFFSANPTLNVMAGISNNGDQPATVSAVCTDWGRACIKSQSKQFFGIRGKTSILGINVYTICDQIQGICYNWAQLVCDLTNFKASAGFYNQASGNKKWTCGDQQGPTGSSVAPAFGSQTSAPRYLKVKGISCKGCGKYRNAPCTGPLVCPTCNLVK